jgi:hypothetical protein
MRIQALTDEAREFLMFVPSINGEWDCNRTAAHFRIKSIDLAQVRGLI